MVEIQVEKNKKLIVERKGDDIIIDGKKSELKYIKESSTIYKVFSENRIYNLEIVERDDNSVSLSINGHVTSIQIRDHISQMLEKLGMEEQASNSAKEIKAPMPGTILSLDVSTGDDVRKGDKILLLEAMKMENVIKSPGAGVVKKILVNQGDAVEKNAVLIEME